MTPLPALAPDEPMLVGALVTRTRRGAGEAELAIRVWCPFSRRAFTLPWDDASGRTNVVRRMLAPSDRGPLVGRTIAVSIDPASAEASWQVASRWRAARAATRAVTVTA